MFGDLAQLLGRIRMEVYSPPYPLSLPLPQPVDDGLVLYLPFQEGTGNITNDISSWGNHGTIVNGTTWVVPQGKRGWGLNFVRASEQGVNVGDLGSLLTKEFTILSCVRPTASPGNFARIAANFDGSDFSFLLGMDFNTKKMRCTAFTSASVGATGTTLFTDTSRFYNVTGRYDGATVKVFIDAVEEKSAIQTGDLRSVSNDTYIGRDGKAGDVSGFDCEMRYILIYNRALSVDEIRTITDKLI